MGTSPAGNSPASFDDSVGPRGTPPLGSPVEEQFPQSPVGAGSGRQAFVMPRMGERDVADESISPTTRVTIMSKSPSPVPSSRGPTISPPSTPPPQHQQQSRFHEHFTPPNNNNKASSKHLTTAAAAPQTPPPVPTPTEEDDIATLNFDRRPSHFDPIAPSFHQRGAGAAPSSHPTQPPRNLVSSSTATGFVPLPPVSPLQQNSPRSTRRQRGGSGGSSSGSTGLSHRKRGSHSRQPSMSLASPTSPSHTYSSSNVNEQQRKILPLEPAAQRALPTRAPLEAFASVEMLQGQRQHQDRTRGVEVFGPGGTYEGRASSQSGFVRREDPLSNLHAARNPAAAAASQFQNYSLGGAGVAQQLPSMDVDAASIASQLRDYDARRDSEVVDDLFPRRYSEYTMPDDELPTLNRSFAFPSKSILAGRPSVASFASTTLDNDEKGSPIRQHPPALRRLFGGTPEDMSGDWRTEHLGNSDKAFGLQRPSVVALPVYPAADGTIGRTFKLRAKKVGSMVAMGTVLAAYAATWVYLSLRIDAMRQVERKRPGVFVGGWCFLALEILVAAMMTVHSLWTVFTYKGRSFEPKMRLRGDVNLPSVDIFIVSSGQTDQTVFDCAVAAASMDYPSHRYRVLVLDPLGSANLERELNKHAKTQACPHLTYHRRDLSSSGTLEKTENEKPKKSSSTAAAETQQAKSNSINFGMREAASLGMKGPSEFIAVFDADVIPERNFLRAVLPHILGENKVGLVKTRHGFINLPHHLNQPTATLLTAAEKPADTRSGFLLRRAALTEIGGFPATSWVHDGECEALLQGRGYKVRQVEEVLQWGMAKPTYTAQLNAMMVNRLGPLRTAHRLGWFVRGEKTRLMPFAARLKAIGRALLPIFSLCMILLAYVYPLMFTFGGILVLTPSLSNLNHLLQATLVMIALHKLHEFLWTWSTGLPSPRRALQAWIFAAPYQGVALLRLALPARLGGYKQRTSDLDINKVVARPQRPTVWARLGWFVLDPLVSTMFAFLAAFGVAIWRIVRDHERGTIDSHQTALTVLLTIAWPTLLWSEFLFACSVPFVCLLFPSRLLTEPRESFLIRDHYTHVARPKHHFKTAPPFKVHHAPEFITSALVLSWAIVCVCVAKLTDVLA
ncbi:hypothetical protein C6P46_003351 [Rhodotorula mucilaginosa]|uniref:Glycosyltransferase family 2 protein n=1 Tax=Rhodotorula mucilaginosa TaxID=5537 RepID=A0A9P7B6F8_RHOMI|nr:hypothetical protein C6P46_003351 [Rhodotorula mucilaginosa]